MVAKHEHFADIWAVISYEAALIAKVYTVDESEIQAFAPRNEFKRDNFTNDVKLDPDKILNTEWVNKFQTLCNEYFDVIQYTPGTYNGRFGFVKNDVEFTTIPPPNSRCYVPKYSKDMLTPLL